MKPIVTFTFDDGTKDHYTHAAPVLEKYGFRGIFNVTTGYVTGTSHWDYPCMTKEDVRDLFCRGHEIASHTVRHVNMRDEWFKNGAIACLKELKESYDDLKDMLGEPVSYFCYPYNRGCPMVSRLARKVGMEPFNPISRPNLGAYNWPTVESDVRRELEGIIFSGKEHIDLMFHGVVPGGGWNSFEDVKDFEFIVSCIKQWECEGRLSVCRYSVAHPKKCGVMFSLVDFFQCLFWPIAYRFHTMIHGRTVYRSTR